MKQRPPLPPRSERPPHESPPMIVNDISHLFFSRVRAMEPEGVMSQHSARGILRLLAREDGIRQQDLAAALHLSAPSVSATLRRMEEEGLVERRHCEGDGRAVRIYLTVRGRAHDENVRLLLRTLDECMMQGFDQNERELLGMMLCRMRENLLKTPVTAGGEEIK